jgi:16S rRNA (guanine966-N2)-methyltransferase
MLKGDRGKYDLIFADPPYFKRPDDTDFVQRLFDSEGLPDRLADGGLLVVEDPPGNRRGEIHGWELLDQRQYGGCGILFYQRPLTG